MNKELNIRIAGEAGQGIQTIGMALNKIFQRSGCFLFTIQDYMSRVRGGNNFIQLRVSDTAVNSARQKISILVALDSDSISIHESDLSPDGIVIVDKKQHRINDEKNFYFNTPLFKLSEMAGGKAIYVNSVAFGVVCGIIRISQKNVVDIIREVFEDSSTAIKDSNIKAVCLGYEYARDNYKPDNFKLNGLPGTNQGYLMNGIEGIALGAIQAGCKFYTAYPMTPSTGIMNIIANHSEEYNIVVEQAEDEIAAVNMAIGASFAGVRSMTATSGGGFALMTEGVSLSGMTETPLVIAEGQRPGPATGFPTRTEQGDLNFILFGGHGEFAKAVFTPGDVKEAFYLTLKAFSIAEKFQIPCIVLYDQHLGDTYEIVDSLESHFLKNNRYIIAKSESQNILNYKRYELTESGISPRAVPSWIKDPIYADSDEHNQEGHIIEDAEVRKKMVCKRFIKKMELLSQELVHPRWEHIDSEIILIGFGSTFGVIKEVSNFIKKKKIGYVHIPQIWPFPVETIQSLLAGKKNVYTVENNAEGQLAKLIARETGIKVKNSILKFDGRPFYFDDLKERLEQIEREGSSC